MSNPPSTSLSFLRNASRLRLPLKSTAARSTIPPSTSTSSRFSSLSSCSSSSLNSTSTRCTHSPYGHNGHESAFRNAMSMRVGSFHSTAGTHASTRSKSKSKSKSKFPPNHKSTSPRKPTPIKTQPTSSRRLARPEAVSNKSELGWTSANRTMSRNRRDSNEPTSSSLPPSPSPSLSPSVLSYAMKTRPQFDRDRAPHRLGDTQPSVGAHAAGDGASSERRQQRDEDRTMARVERDREERDRDRDRRRAREVGRTDMGMGMGRSHRLRGSGVEMGMGMDRETESSPVSVSDPKKSKTMERRSQRGEEERGGHLGEFYQPKRLAEGGVGGLNAYTPTPTPTDADVSISNKGDATKLPTSFTSPPLLPGFVHALEDMFGSATSRSSDSDGHSARPTVIQALSLKWIGQWIWGIWGGGSTGAETASAQTTTKPTTTKTVAPTPTPPPGGWRQFLLAAETGSGKSIAYLLPMLQALKMTEPSFVSSIAPPSVQTKTKTKAKKLPTYAPRGIVLAPTHELARQLTGFAKELVHYPDAKLKVVSASTDNTKGVKEREKREKRGMRGMDGVVYDYDTASDGEHGSKGKGDKMGGRGADVLVGTPRKLLEMVRGRGWDRLPLDGMALDGEEEEEQEHWNRPRDRVARFGLGSVTNTKYRDLALEDVEWVVIDEADVLFDPDFEASTRQLLADISSARGVSVPLLPFEQLSSLPAPSSSSSPSLSSAPPRSPSSSSTITYPFHLLLASATIPTSLNSYLSQVHPRLLRLASPGLHKLPKKLGVEYVRWTGGSKEKDVWKRIREVWRDDWVEAASSSSSAPNMDGDNNNKIKKQEVELSQIVIFCNKSSKAEELGAFLSEQISSSPLKDEIGGGNNKGVLVITGGKGSVGRTMGSNKHLDSFLRVRESTKRRKTSSTSLSPNENEGFPKPMKKPTAKPLILITTSLLSRGLDFAPSVKHVFVVDPPRNKVDFLHRAGRAGRAGMSGRVVVFGRSGEELGRELSRAGGLRDTRGKR